jgi:tetratricopeptide (TPR) repeat protein
MIKYYVIGIVTLTSCFSSFASIEKTILPPDSTATIVEKTAAAYLIEEGKGLFAQGKYRDAMTKFRDALQKDVFSSSAALWIGRCHYEQYNYGYALKYAKDAVLFNNNVVKGEMYDLLATAYHRLGNLDSAIMYYELGMKHLPKNRVSDLKLASQYEQAKYAKQVMENPVDNKRVSLEGNVNSGYNDYSPVVFNGGKSMYFTSRRSNTTGGRQNPSDQQFFEDIYSAKWSAEDKVWDSVTNRIGRINGEGFESISYISEDGMIAYITLNNSATVDAKPMTRSSDIAELKWTKQNQWSAPRLIKELNSSFYDGNATVTADGQTMYFVSERNGQSKMSEIYVSYKKGNTWSAPKALPSEINSKGRETTPYITPDGRYLFFSSNGHANSLGGYDVYVVERMGNSWGEVKNLGPTINTVNDDFGFQIYDAIGKAYINGIKIVDDKASLDIFEFNIKLQEVINAAIK